MKKLILSIVTLFAITFTVNAQEQKLNSHDKAVKDANELKTLLKLDDTKTDDFVRLFNMKYLYQEMNLSDERKSVISKTIEEKLRASLTPDQMKIIESNKELFLRLTK